MELDTAIHFISPGIVKNSGVQVWADFGSGKGLFVSALANILGQGSTVYAVDKDHRALDQIKIPQQITLKKMPADFTSGEFQIEPLDGILMINSLHFVSDKNSLFGRIKSLLKPMGRIIVGEYNTDKPNPWVPYPISFPKLQEIAQPHFTSVTKMEEIPSAYGRATMFSARLLPG